MRGDRLLALVTGAGSGIGRATSHRLIADGYHVCGLDLDEEGLQETGQRAPGAFTAHVLDVADTGALEAALRAVVDELGIPDVLVNNAGIGVAATTPETTVADWDRTVAVNLSAVFHTCRLLLPHMIARGHGAIVNVASVAAIVGVARRAAYCASKAGVVGLTRAIAVDHAAEGIRVNAICPGTVATEWIGKILANAPDPDKARAAMEKRQLDGRMGTPEEVAAGISFLASPEARFVNGSAFVMDGGMSAL